MKWRPVVRQWLKWALVAASVLAVAGYLLISYLIASGITKADRKTQEDQPSNYGLAYEDVSFLSRRGDVKLEGWLVHGRPAYSTLVLVHGLGSTRSGDKAVELSARLQEKGYSVLLFDLRGHGSSGGSKVSAGYYEKEDVLSAFDFLVQQGTPPERIGLLGFSMGAATAILAAAEEPRIHAVVADSPFAKASEFLANETARKTVIPEWLAPVFIPTAKLMARGLYGINIGSITPEEAVKRLAYPILVIHGTADVRIPPSNGERVYQAAFPGSSLWLVPGVGHVDAFNDFPDEYVQRVDQYFSSRLPTPSGAAVH
jgi:pimeloyl-ACP methyl ester carboxylesterase